LSLAEELAVLVAALVTTTGDPLALSVVKVLSAPNLVPPLLVADIEQFLFCIFSVKCSSVLPELMSDARAAPSELKRHVFRRSPMLNR
jgi:hypothetical protein